MLDQPERRRKSVSDRRSSALRQAELLLEVTNELARAQNLDSALRVMRDIAIRVIGSERGSVFLHDARTGELYARIGGRFAREIRMLSNSGVAGSVFTSGIGAVIPDAYADERFNSAFDRQSAGFKTRNILCAPLRTLKGEIIGATQLLNKLDGNYTPADLALLEAIISQASVSLEAFRTIETIERARQQELDFLSVVSDISSELKLGPLVHKIMGAISRMLDADRSTVFLNDEKTNELYIFAGQGVDAAKIRMPNHLGIAGAVFTSGQSVNIPHCYADLRFNPAFDRKSGYFTRSMLCVPINSKSGQVIGVTQVLNKRGGTFSPEDEARLKAFTSQISIGLENAKLFDDVQAIKSYNESILESMTNGVITLNEEAKVVTCNAAGGRIFKVNVGDVVGHAAEQFFAGDNAWIVDKIKAVGHSGGNEVMVDAPLIIDGETLSINLTVMPLKGGDKILGSLVMIEDISGEKRMKSTMSRYMDPTLADQLLASGADILGGHTVNATILFSDVRGFTTLSEELGAQGIISLLNEYFTLMVDCITDQGGMLDKFIGDAIMAVFGTAKRHDDDEDRALRTAIAMMVQLHGFNQRRVADGKRPIDIGIGLNTDMVVSGNIGSPKRQDYTVIGDGVNLAARLEGACKEYGAHILCSENTVRKLKGTYRAREIDYIVVKGKTKPVALYEIVDYHTDDTFPNMMGVLQAFQYGLKGYREGKFASAKKAFTEALGLNPNDYASKLFSARCDDLLANPPGDAWNGVWVMTSK